VFIPEELQDSLFGPRRWANAARLSRRDILTIRYRTTYINAMHVKNGSWVGQFEFSLIVSRLRKFKRTHYRKMGSGVVYGNAN